MNWELPDVQARFRKGRETTDQIANICWIIKKPREFQNIYFCFIDYAKAFVWITTNCGKFLKSWEHQSISWPQLIHIMRTAHIFFWNGSLEPVLCKGPLFAKKDLEGQASVSSPILRIKTYRILHVPEELSDEIESLLIPGLFWILLLLRAFTIFSFPLSCVSLC